MCGKLHLQWAPRAQQLIDTALTEFGERRSAGSCANCAVQTMRALQSSTRMQAEDCVLLSGLAGGVGLLGNVCGALAAGVFAMSADQQLGRQQEHRDSRIRGSLEELAGARYRGAATRLRHDFVERFGSELCVEITGRRFQDVMDHAAFVEQRGCENVTRFVADWSAGHPPGGRASA